MIDAMIGTNSAAPPPKPAAVRPAAKPRSFVNHFNADPMHPP